METPARFSHVHVIDLDFRRRAQISRQLIGRNLHAEIYEHPSEFIHRMPASGPILINEEPQQDTLGEFFGQLRESGRFFPVTVYSEGPTTEQVVRAMREGAIDYLHWPFDEKALAQGLERLFEEGNRRARLEHEKSEARQKVDRLTQREREVLVSLLRGNANKEVALELEISPRTVEIYRKNMMEKLRARSVSEAARIGVYAGLWIALTA